MEQRYYVRLGSKVRGPLSAKKLRRLRDEGKLPSSAEFSSDQQIWSQSLPGKNGPRPRRRTRRSVADRYDVFISYCREDGATIDRLLVDKLTAQGNRVFLDVEGLGAGSWSRVLERRISECPDFVVVLTKAYIVWLRSEGSVIQQEVATAHGREVQRLRVRALEGRQGARRGLCG